MWIDFLSFLKDAATPIGVFLAFLTLLSNHNWYRREFAARLAKDWNPQTIEHRKAIEAYKPGLIDIDKKSNQPSELTRDDAEKIYRSKPGDPNWDVRFHLIQLLNYCEYVSSVYVNSVADKYIVEESMKNSLILWHSVLRNYIDVVSENRNYNPWAPYTNLVDHWTKRSISMRRRLP